MLNFASTPAELDLFLAIVKRAEQMCRERGAEAPDRLIALMDMTVANNSCPLRLLDLLQAEPADFAHDVFGIYRHIDRSTGELRDCFLPRFARRQEEARR